MSNSAESGSGPRWWNKVTALVAIGFVAIAAYLLINWIIDPSPPAPPEGSIAVLSFESLSGQPGDEYMASGFQVALVHALHGMDNYKVKIGPKNYEVIDVVERRAGALLDGYTHDARVVYLYHLAHRASRQMEQVLGEQLHAENIEGLDLVLELARSPDIEYLDVVTLNHDTLVEELLAKNGIPFADGFGPPDGSVRWYDDGLFDGRSSKVRIIKPHGSVNWYSSSVNGRPQTVIVESNDPITSRTENDEQIRIYSNQPSFLTGGSKILAYNRGIYSEMFYRFHLMLREHRFMIMSGYGWSDTGINFRLTNWLDTYRESSMLLLNEKPENLSGNSLQLDEYYDGLVSQGQIIPGTEYLSGTKMNDVHNYWHGRVLK